MERVDPKSYLPWQSLPDFTASTTLSEKVWRVANNLLFVVAGLSLYATAARKMRLAPPALSYAGYVTIALAVRKIVAILIGYAAYPAIYIYSKKELEKAEKAQFESLKNIGFITQKITLHKSGVAYNATVVGDRDTLASGKWCIHALGNQMAMEGSVLNVSLENRSNGANTLLINGPSVGRSGGFPTRYQMGAGFEAGLQFLEKKVQATHIVFKGLSLGNGMMSEAVQIHTFDPNVKYLGISDRTFGYLSSSAAAIISPILAPLFYLSGAELDGVAGAEKLKELEIEHIIIQHWQGQEVGRATDGVIPDNVGLASQLKQAPTRTFLQSNQIFHNGDLPRFIQIKLDQKIKEFFATTSTI